MIIIMITIIIIMMNIIKITKRVHLNKKFELKIYKKKLQFLVNPERCKMLI